MSVTSDILTAIEEAPTIILHRHQRPDLDALGSQLGLKSIIQAAFPQKAVWAVGEMPGDFAWLGTMDTIDDAQYQNALVIVLDTANTERIDDGRYATGNQLIKIDHHPNDDAYGLPMWVLPKASSTSELIVDLVNDSHGVLKLNQTAAIALYAGIVGDTGRFLYPATSAHTFAVASELLATGIDAAAVSRHDSELSRGIGRLMGDVLNQLTIDQDGAASYVVTQKRLHELNVSTEAVHDLVSTPGRLADVIAWQIFVETPAGDYRVHLRSKGPVINELAKQHRGGGHELASGATAANLDEVEEMIHQLATIVHDWRQAH